MFHTSQSNDLVGFRSKTISQQVLSTYDFGLKYEKARSPLDLLRQTVVKVKALVLLAKAAKVKISKTYYGNPLYY
jgi:Piezo non-specific cation channel, R-Ras-binding domain